MQEVTDALYYAMDLLRSQAVITNEKSKKPSDRSKVMGNEIAEVLISIISDYELVTDEELVPEHELNYIQGETHEEHVGTSSDEITSPEESRSRSPSPQEPVAISKVPFEMRKKVVALAESHVVDTYITK